MLSIRIKKAKINILALVDFDINFIVDFNMLVNNKTMWVPYYPVQ